MQHAARTGFNGNTYNVWLNGWLGSTTETEAHAEVFKYMKGHENWQQCFSIVNVIDGHDFYLNQYAINKNNGVYRAAVDGFLYEEGS